MKIGQLWAKVKAQGERSPKGNNIFNHYSGCARS